MSKIMDTKKVTGKLSAIAISILLASCGGGDGYYGKNDSSTGGDGSTTTPKPVVTNYHIVMNASKPTLNVAGDKVALTVKLVDVNGGGVPSQQVSLAIEDTQNNGVTIAGASTAITDELGNAVFNLELNGANVKNINDLVAKGIRLTAQFTDTSGKITSQTMLLNASNSTSGIEALLHLNLSTNKPTLVVTGDSALITVKAVDENGGGVSGQTVSLAILDTKTNQVTISGASNQTTDNDGNATFTIVLPNASGNVADNLIKNGITLNASIKDSNGVVTLQSTKLNVVSAVVTQPIGNITFGRAGVILKNTEQTYYTEALSAHVVDIDGKPIANQTVTMSIDFLTAYEGVFKLKQELDNIRQNDILTLKAKLATASGKLQQANSELADLQTQLSDSKIELDQQKAISPATADSIAEINRINNLITTLNGQISAKKSLINSSQATVTALQAGVEALTSLVIPPRTPVKCAIAGSKPLATGFVSPEGTITPTFTYTTDSTGKFDFKVNYLRSFANWQDVQLNADVKVSGSSLRSSMNYGLGIMKEDNDSEAGQPFDASPYGTNCPFTKPWQGIMNAF
ncbi:hypothetical protein [Acinetobacter bereziniae]|uniref:hypothetical protein n=2 Tax=Acinetobacter bereziniae TaxID=106648 RepID=UPI00125EC813|nr:hypothetical protein [Acinetobacter bereziniae]MBI0395536.1 hypothetical protein [Acinetobacter bereziniae]MDM1783349.1 hypothetical protein [Acinetobacter bereziniae]WEI22153.1 hypothetical protein PYR74_19860 [Acinetobacter bereziniae]